MKKVHEAVNAAGDVVVKVHYNPEFQEFRARPYVNGKAVESGDYFTNDAQDAKNTADSMAKSWVK